MVWFSLRSLLPLSIQTLGTLIETLLVPLSRHRVASWGCVSEPQGHHIPNGNLMPQPLSFSPVDGAEEDHATLPNHSLEAHC